MRRFFVILFISICYVVNAQDTAKLLSEDDFIHLVRSYHPVMKQASLLVDRAYADLIAARAGFDPRFYIQAERKTLDGKTYYDYTNPELKIPTWFGVELKAGREQNLGLYQNPEFTNGQSSYMGMTVPLLKNLLMDKRRAILKQAKIFRDQSRSEQLLAINDLFMQAYEAYWLWVRTYEAYRIIQETVSVNKQRYALVRIGHQQGDRPAMDTTEALAQLQSFELAKEHAFMEWRNATFALSNYIWSVDEQPVVLTEEVSPSVVWKSQQISTAKLPVLQDILMQARTEHPKLKIYSFKLDALNIEKQLKFQSLLPVADLSYNLINKGYNVFNNPNAAFFNNNYKYGFTVGMPLRFSQGRGEYKAAKIKIRDTNLDLIKDRIAIDNKIKSYFNELTQLQQQVSIAEQALTNYTRLFKGEELKFKVGESSLFLLNSRENKVLESRQKLIELQTKFYKAYRALAWAAGQLR